MTPANKRRWSYSLRTLFAVVTVACIALGWLAWQERIVRHRKDMIRQIESDGGNVFVEDIEWPNSPLAKEIRPGDVPFRISSIRRWLGDKRVGLIGFNRKLTVFDQEAIESIPEAPIYAIP